MDRRPQQPDPKYSAVILRACSLPPHMFCNACLSLPRPRRWASQDTCINLGPFSTPPAMEVLPLSNHSEANLYLLLSMLTMM